VDVPQEWQRLESSVRRLLDEHADYRSRLESAEARVRELESTIEQVSVGTLDPQALTEEVERLRDENRQLEARVAKAAAKVRALLSKIQFLEDDR
jgi:seryl-tRNA synthetase